MNDSDRDHGQDRYDLLVVGSANADLVVGVEQPARGR